MELVDFLVGHLQEKKDYPHDIENAQWSISHLEEFIEKILTKTNIPKITSDRSQYGKQSFIIYN